MYASACACHAVYLARAGACPMSACEVRLHALLVVKCACVPVLLLFELACSCTLMRHIHDWQSNAPAIRLSDPAESGANPQRFRRTPLSDLSMGQSVEQRWLGSIRRRTALFLDF